MQALARPNPGSSEVDGEAEVMADARPDARPISPSEPTVSRSRRVKPSQSRFGPPSTRIMDQPPGDQSLGSLDYDRFQELFNKDQGWSSLKSIRARSQTSDGRCPQGRG